MKELTPILAADLVETESNYQVHVDLPGVDATDLHVTIANGSLHISAERKQVHENKSGLSHRIERSFGTVERAVAIPKNAVADSAETNFSNGVLTVTFAKKDNEAPRKLEIRTPSASA
jgi:HSP20 family protein